jgi:hypothetical protein
VCVDKRLQLLAKKPITKLETKIWHSSSHLRTNEECFYKYVSKLWEEQAPKSTVTVKQIVRGHKKYKKELEQIYELLVANILSELTLEQFISVIKQEIQTTVSYTCSYFYVEGYNKCFTLKDIYTLIE